MKSAIYTIILAVSEHEEKTFWENFFYYHRRGVQSNINLQQAQLFYFKIAWAYYLSQVPGITS